MDAVRAAIRDIPDFPQKGILFKDITPVLGDAALFRRVIDALAARWGGERIDKVVGIESRGFLFAAPLAYALRRRRDRGPQAGQAALEGDPRGLLAGVRRERARAARGRHRPGERVLVVDDVLATGGTAAATGRLVTRQGGVLVGYSFLVELGFLEGAGRLGAARVHSLIKF